jgi:hypothetical protein
LFNGINKTSWWLSMGIQINFMRSFLIIFFLFCTTALFGQDEYMLTKYQHDQIKKNLADYKKLIGSFDSLSKKFDVLTQQFQLCKTLRNNDKAEFDKIYEKLQASNQTEINNYKIRYENLKINNEGLQSEILKLNKQLENLSKSHITLRFKYQREIETTRGDRLMANSVWAIMASCTALIIYSTIDKKRN